MKILLAIDGSPCSDAAVAEVCRRPWPPQCQVRLITADTPMDKQYCSSAFLRVFDEFNSQLRTKAIEHLDDAAAFFEEHAPDLPVNKVLVEGYPKDAILEHAESWDADLIVIGSHGYEPIRRLFLGSVSLRVPSGASCSVEIVRPKQPKSDDACPETE